ncbi:TPA: hypothetical protein JLN01_003962 [Escherichia coli]|uniref:hypothetical protein n=1 Tax=Escherichia coli TaxID=562 RepID=UPI000BE41794|nr:hypothetical protein [Escherichia coli]MBB7852836.1 hypothetical protein [Escherichia coli]HAV9868198.1 hypothetical protein [Escherichia coli]HAW1621173.1 hypothetical protein [Escherichia coli]HAW4079041.1 hypothetical protein [Escherichia coli]
MTSIIKYIIAAVILFCSNSVHAECLDTPAKLKAQDAVNMSCISQEKNLLLLIYSSTHGDIFVGFLTMPPKSCNINIQESKAPSKVINEKTVRFVRICSIYTDAPEKTVSYDIPATMAGFNYIKKQILKNKPLVVTSPNKDNPFKATFDTHKYREMILDAFNANDGLHGGI